MEHFTVYWNNYDNNTTSMHKVFESYEFIVIWLSLRGAPPYAHPAAAAVTFNMADEVNELKNDVRANGLRHSTNGYRRSPKASRATSGAGTDSLLDCFEIYFRQHNSTIRSTDITISIWSI